jgi:hypothetical protein
MDLESIMPYLNEKDLTAVEIHTEINHVLGEGTIGYLTVTRYLRKQNFADSSTLSPEDREIQGPDAIDKAILQALDEHPYASLRQIGKRVLVPISTVRHRLVSKMASKLKHCRWVPDRRSEAQKQTRVTPSKRLLGLLRSIQHQGWKYFSTLGEAWFYFSNQHEEIWRPGHEDPQQLNAK